MLKVKLKHSGAEVAQVYRILTDNLVVILGTDTWNDTTTCLIENDTKLTNILHQLNKATHMGVSLRSSRPTLETILRSIFK